MAKLVIQFHPDGSVETLRNKSIDLRKLGSAKVERISSVEFDEASQRFYIQWLKGPRAGSCEHLPTQSGGPSIVLWTFDTYEDAVAHEIAEVNKMRLAGASFA